MIGDEFLELLLVTHYANANITTALLMLVFFSSLPIQIICKAKTKIKTRVNIQLPLIRGFSVFQITSITCLCRVLKCFHWTGNNQFFVDSAKEFISIGGGEGKSGLWLDNNLNHGRSQRCETFDNDLLSGEGEEFRVQLIEVFGFHVWITITT